MNNKNFFFSETKRIISKPLQNTLRLSKEPLSNVYILIRLQLGKSLQNVKKINNELMFYKLKPEHPGEHHGEDDNVVRTQNLVQSQ